MNYYFAYGSNMNQAQMRERCPDAVLIGKARLPGYRLGFTIYSPIRKCGCADILADEGAEVWGLIYKLTDEDLARMDEYEGVPQHYRRTSISVVLQSGLVIECLSYEVVNKHSRLAPSKSYLDLLTGAANEFGFPKEYRRKLEAVTTQP